MSAILEQDVVAFETHRRALTGFAYRMLGSRAEAEDVVQDAYLRWHTADHAAINEPRRYLVTVVTRLCLDRMKSAQARRETYVGQWLPEPLVDETFGDEVAGDLAHDISVALMLVLERLSPLERASFLLHDVFGLDFVEVGRALGGGKRVAALNPIFGRDKVLRFLDGVSRKNPGLAALAVRAATVNGLPGFVLRGEDGAIDTVAFETREGSITAIYITRNPDKLRHVRF